jgi:hypothetical protein
MCSGSRKEMCSISYFIPYNSDAFNVDLKPLLLKFLKLSGAFPFSLEN